MEELYAYVYLWTFGFITCKEYNKYLDTLFVNETDNEILLELESCASDYRKSFAILNRYFEYEIQSFDISLFGRTLFAGLRKIYETNLVTIQDFGKCCYDMWKLLPVEICMQEPFYTLSYADDCLSYGDEPQTRTIYEAVFSFYGDV